MAQKHNTSMAMAVLHITREAATTSNVSTVHRCMKAQKDKTCLPFIVNSVHTKFYRDISYYYTNR